MLRGRRKRGSRQGGRVCRKYCHYVKKIGCQDTETEGADANNELMSKLRANSLAMRTSTALSELRCLVNSSLPQDQILMKLTSDSS